jgi:hypothetical protein
LGLDHQFQAALSSVGNAIALGGRRKLIAPGLGQFLRILGFGHVVRFPNSQSIPNAQAVGSSWVVRGEHESVGGKVKQK